MLVRRLIGREAGEIIDMSAPDALRAIQGSAVEALNPVEAAQYVSDSWVEDKVAEVRAMVSVASPPTAQAAPVKRKGGWPKGKKRVPKVAIPATPMYRGQPDGVQD